MRFFVLGGGGFIGHNVVNKLLERGHKVINIDWRSPYDKYQDDRKPSKHLLKNYKSRMYHVRYATKKFGLYSDDVVIHLANTPNQAMFNSGTVTPKEIFLENMLTNTNVAEWCCYSRATLVYISSSMVYGDWINSINETAHTNPINEYGRMKLMTENLIHDSLENYTIIRPTAVYGKYDDGRRVITKWITQAKQHDPIIVDDPDATLDFTHVSDTAEGIVLAALNSAANRETFNISAGRSVKLIDAAQQIVKLTNSYSNIICGTKLPDDMPRRGSLDIGKAKNILNYNPQYVFEDGIKTLL